MYIVRPLLNHEAVAAWARSEGYDNHPLFWHLTVGRVRRSFDRSLLDARKVSLRFSAYRSIQRMGYELALVCPSDRLQKRHRELRELGAEWDYRRYIPHVSFAPYQRQDVSQIVAYRGPIILGPECLPTDLQMET